MLCKVIEDMSITIRLVLWEVFSFLAVSLSKRISPRNKSRPPLKKLIDTTSQGIIPKLLDISMAGDKREKNVAAIITPAAKPSMASRTVLLTFLNKKTTAEPSEVIPQVKRHAINAIKGYDKFVNRLNTVNLLLY